MEKKVLSVTGVYEGEKSAGRFFEHRESCGLLKSKIESTGEFTLVGEFGKMHRCIIVPHPQGKAQEEIIHKICALWK